MVPILPWDWGFTWRRGSECDRARGLAGVGQGVVVGTAGHLCLLLATFLTQGCLTLASQKAVIRPFSTVTRVEKVLCE
jgi:hypothetical protein